MKNLKTVPFWLKIVTTLLLVLNVAGRIPGAGEIYAVSAIEDALTAILGLMLGAGLARGDGTPPGDADGALSDDYTSAASVPKPVDTDTAIIL